MILNFSHIGFSPKIFNSKTEIAAKKPGNLSRVLLKTSESSENISDDSQVPSTSFFGDSASEENESDSEPDEGVKDMASVEDDLNEIFNRAVNNGFPEKYHGELRQLLEEYEDIFRKQIRRRPTGQYSSNENKTKTKH